MKKILSMQVELNFRALLVRNTLQLDTIPNHDTVHTYAEHLLAELEQMVHLEKKTKQAPVVAEVAVTTKAMVKQVDGSGRGGCSRRLEGSEQVSAFICVPTIQPVVRWPAPWIWLQDAQ